MRRYLGFMMGTCAALAGCGDDVEAPGVAWDAGATVVDAGTSAGDVGSPPDRGESGDTGQPAADAGTPAEDTGPEPACDVDGDGFLSEACGGRDCDDEDRSANPDGTERCSFVDENCDGDNNEDLDCSFWAHGPRRLFSVDPFEQVVEEIGPTTLDGRRISLFDIDIDPQGQLVGISSNQLIQLDNEGRGRTVARVRTPANINGLAIDSEGTIFLTQSSGRPAQAYTLTMDGRLDSLGDLTPYASSGDCVVLKDDSLLMTSRNPEGGNDLLVYVDSRSAQTRLIGTMGAPRVYALSASFGYLFGLTDEGRVLLVNDQTGATEELFRQAGVQFYGAANGD